MIYTLLNWQPILAATLIGLAAGFGWWALTGGLRLTAGLLAAALIAQGWLAAILAGALILAPPQADRWTMGLGSAFIIWVGFVLPTIALTHRRRGLGAAATLADSAHWLIVMLVQAAVLILIGLSPPPGA